MSSDEFKRIEAMIQSEIAKKAIEQFAIEDQFKAMTEKPDEGNYKRFLAVKKYCDTLIAEYGCELMSVVELHYASQGQIKLRFPCDFTFADNDPLTPEMSIIRDLVYLADGVNICATGLDDGTFEMIFFVDGIFGDTSK